MLHVHFSCGSRHGMGRLSTKKGKLYEGTNELPVLIYMTQIIIGLVCITSGYGRVF